VSHGFSNLAGRTMPEVITPLALSPKAAAAILSISRRKLDLLIADGVLKARKDGSRTLVDYQSVKAYYEGLPAKISVSIPNSPQAQR
jgi:excisionase family DNA binding protein